MTFQSTRPVRGATVSAVVTIDAAVFQSTRPVRGATIMAVSRICDILFQSTRPVRGATGSPAGGSPGGYISIHAPRAGRDRVGVEAIKILRLFQSTRPVRGATCRPACGSF